MTAVVPEVVDLTDLADLDFTTPVLCDVNECHHDKINAQRAVARLIRTHECCTAAAPICRMHAEEVLISQLLHVLVSCPKHRQRRCAHLAVRLEPLS